MKHIKRVFLIVLLSVITCSFGCGNTVSSVSENASSTNISLPDAVIKLNYYVWGDELPYATSAANAFNALHNDILVSVFSLSNTSYETLLDQTLNDSSVTVDLFGTKGMASTIQFVQKKKSLDITDKVKDSIKDGSLNVSAYGTMFNSILYQNRYYSLPSRSTCWELYYNKDLFDQAGLSYPEQMTWSEYCILAKKLTTGNGTAKKWGGYWVNWIPNFIALQHGSYLTDDDLSYTRQSLELMNQLYAIDCSHVSYQAMANAPDPSHDVYQMFEAGKIAMVPQGEWMINELLGSNTSVDWDIAPMPIDQGEEAGTTVGQYQFVNIAASCAHPAEAFEFMKFFCGKEGATIYAQNAILPAYLDDNISNDYLKATVKESARIFLAARKYVEQPPVSGYQECIEAFTKQSDLYFNGKQTLDETIEHFDSLRRTYYQ